LNETICNGDTYLFDGTFLSDPGNYTATLVAANSCDSIVDLFLEVAPVYITDFTDTICEGEFILFDGNEIDSSGFYSANYLSVSGCDSVITLALTVNEVNAGIFQTGDSLAAIGSGNYQWIYCESGVTIPGATDEYFVPSISGSYAVIITMDECADTSTCMGIATGLNESSAQRTLMVYPNPAIDAITIMINPPPRDAILVIEDILGETILQMNCDLCNNALIDVKAFSAGIYFVEIHSGEKRYSAKFIKQ
jgi:hypothetical protein